MEKKIVIGGLASLGLYQDLPASVLPPEAWTTALNMRFDNGRAKRVGGKSQVWTPSVAPYFHKFVVSPAGVPWWLYASLTKVYAYDFASHTDITRLVGGDYNADSAADWNATVLGGIPILNEGASVPQYWPAFNSGSELEDLPNWPATYRCKSIHAFGVHLIALGITKAGTYYPHLVKWSDPADPGAVPSSWDETIETGEAGENPLADVHAGEIQDGGQLGSLFYIYKNRSTWTMRRIGGRFVFDFDTFFSETGIIAPRCVVRCNQGGWHFMFTEDNMIVHDGSQVIPLLTKRMQRTIFGRIDQAAKNSCFVFHHPSKNEVWACYPENGNETPNMALVWNYAEGGQNGVLSEVEIDFVGAANGELQSEDIEWDEESAQEWGSDEELWSTNSLNAVVVARPTATKALVLEGDVSNDGSTFTATLAREGLALEGRDRANNWIVDWVSRKLVTRVWIRGGDGPINVRIGSQLVPDGAVTWTSYATFDPSTAQYVDLITEGRGISIEFSTTDNVDWNIFSYSIEQVENSEF